MEVNIELGGCSTVEEIKAAIKEYFLKAGELVYDNEADGYSKRSFISHMWLQGELVEYVRQRTLLKVVKTGDNVTELRFVGVIIFEHKQTITSTGNVRFFSFDIVDC